MKTMTIYLTRDGKHHHTKREAHAWEAENPEVNLVGLTAEELAGAMAGVEPEIADALERVGAKLARQRREAGDLKRRRSNGEAIPDPVSVTAEEAGAPREPIGVEEVI